MSAERIVGFHPVRELLRKSPGAVRRVFVLSGRGGQRRREIERLCHESAIPIVEVTSAELSRHSRGVVSNGFGAEIELRQALQPPSGIGDPDLIVLAEDVQDPRNLGALLRVCEGVGVGLVLLREHGSASLGETVEKTSAGAAAWVEVERIGSPAQTLKRFKEEGFWVYGLDLDGVPPWEVDLTGKVLLCVGGEQSGLRRLTREACDRLITLPMRGRVESLNLTTAASAVLYEAVRQRARGAVAAARAPSPSLSAPAERG